jgi:hypothetical protein
MSYPRITHPRGRWIVSRKRLAEHAERRGSSLVGGLGLNDANVVFLSRSDTWNDYAQLSVDQSSRGVNLTNATNWAHNTTHGLALPTNEWTAEFLVQVRTGINNRYLYELCVATNSTRYQGLRCTTTDLVHTINATSPGTGLAIPNLAAGHRTYLMTQSVQPNPGTTGPSNALHSVLRIWDIAAGTFHTATLNMAVAAGQGAQTNLGAFTTLGAGAFSTDGHGRIAYCRISNVARTREEIEAVIPQILAATKPHPLADEDTVFLSMASAWNDYSRLSVDRSGRGVNLTNATTYGHGSWAEMDSAGPRTIELLADLANGSTNGHGITTRGSGADDVATARWEIFHSVATQVVRANVGTGSARPQAVAAAPPNLGTTARRYLIAWTDEPNPNTTGPSDARTSTMRIWDVATNDFAEASANHVAAATDVTSLILGAWTSTGTFPWRVVSPVRSLAYCRISNRARTREEIEAALPLILAGSPA